MAALSNKLLRSLKRLRFLCSIGDLSCMRFVIHGFLDIGAFLYNCCNIRLRGQNNSTYIFERVVIKNNIIYDIFTELHGKKNAKQEGIE